MRILTRKLLAATGLLLLLLSSGCNTVRNDTGLYHGRLEVEKTRLSAPLAGEIDTILVREGQRITAGQLLARLATERLELELNGLAAQDQELELSREGLQFQTRQLQSRLALVETNLARTEKLLHEGAIPGTRLDELQTEQVVLVNQLAAIDNQRQVLTSKRSQLAAARATLNWQLEQAALTAPLDGIVLTLYTSRGEWLAPGLPVLELGDPSELEATIYLPLPDLPRARIGGGATVYADGSADSFNGRISWISEETEFTPKTIQTRETRTALVCAVRISVANPDGLLKAGMPVDVRLD